MVSDRIVTELPSGRPILKAATAGSMNVRWRATWSTFGPHAIGSERFVTVSSGRSFAQVAGAILRKQARGRTLIRMRPLVQVQPGPQIGP
jgi:hypothetical protein